MESIQDSVIAFWNHPDCVDGYDGPHRPGFDVAGNRAAWRRELADRLPGAPAQVLDLGSGTGFLSILLAELGHDVRGVELADNMLGLARRKAAQDGLGIRFEKGDAQDPPGEPGSADVVTCRFLFWTLEDPAALVSAAMRLLRPGGSLVIFDGIWFPRGWDPESFQDKCWYQWWLSCYSPPVRRRLPLLERNRADKVAALVAEAGFTDVSTGPLEHVERVRAETADESGSHDQCYAVWAAKPGGGAG
ncbi:MAG: class I SAM-dependent methyltransferase [Pseudonocardiaceae bacterium]